MSYIALKTWNFAQSRFLRKHWHCILRFPENPPKVSHCLEWVSEQESVLPAAHIQQNLRCDYVSLGAQGMFTIRFSKVSFQSKGHHIKDSALEDWRCSKIQLRSCSALQELEQRLSTTDTLRAEELRVLSSWLKTLLPSAYTGKWSRWT